MMDKQGAKSLATQVGGHAGVLSDASGSLVIKAASPREIAFYQLLASCTLPTEYSPEDDNEHETAASRAMFNFKRCIPKFLGTLKVEGRVSGDEIKEATIPGESIVIENITSPFFRPSILDVKLGTVTHEEDATEEKKARMIASAKKSTSFETGLRLTGFQTWHPRLGKNIVTDRDFGRTVSKEKLPEGMAMFFPDPVEGPPSTTDDQALTPPDDVSTEPKAFSATTHRQNLIRVLRALHSTLAHFHSIVAAMNIRFIGASLLIVYESDPDALAEAWNKADQGQVAGDGLEKEVLVDLDDEDKAESDESDEDDKDEPSPPWSIRMIDFAHTRLVEPSEGPDEGVLLGIRTLGELVRGRVRELGGDEEGLEMRKGEEQVMAAVERSLDQ